MSRTTTRQLPASQVTTETQRLNRKLRAAQKAAREAKARGSVFAHNMAEREAAQIKRLLKSAARRQSQLDQRLPPVR